MVRWSKTSPWGKTPLTDSLRRSLSICPGFWLHKVHMTAKVFNINSCGNVQKMS